ncbi:MAG TPA: DUF5610 domain-containing protein [Candidatus Wallbacteria bacterium]|nr:MAG: hypothetical protein BWY32_00719 [bacterium ADurb.Bin243]HOD39199.1 DUF5610 domain-containing protein [Candidatus Wallbacteria bacterium]HPG56562.1 DUF5610 domain-containing protein [Candidatus Wallbacteria bacterium]
MNIINPSSIFQNISNWQSLNPDKKSGISNNPNGMPGLFNAGQSNGVSDFQSIINSLKDASKSQEFASSVIEGRVEYNLKAAFQTDSGQKINMELNVKVDFRFEQATAAYSKGKTTQSDSGDEFSPENTAKRIGNFAMGFLGAFQTNHAGQEKSDSLDGFFNLAKDAIAKGFDQAKNILGDLYGETGEKTYDLVMKFMDDAKNRLLDMDKTAYSALANLEKK